MPLFNNLETYIGVPLIHGRFNLTHCNYIIENVQKKLAYWKANCLSFIGRKTLIQVVSSTIQSYSMQTMKLLFTVHNNKIDNFNRDFI